MFSCQFVDHVMSQHSGRYSGLRKCYRLMTLRIVMTPAINTVEIKITWHSHVAPFTISTPVSKDLYSKARSQFRNAYSKATTNHKFMGHLSILWFLRKRKYLIKCNGNFQSRLKSIRGGFWNTYFKYSDWNSTQTTPPELAILPFSIEPTNSRTPMVNGKQNVDDTSTHPERLSEKWDG